MADLSFITSCCQISNSCSITSFHCFDKSPRQFFREVSFRSLILHTAAPQYQYKVLSDSFDRWHLPPLIPSPTISLSVFFRRTCSCMMVLTNTWRALTALWTLSRGLVFKFANNPSKIIGSCAGFPGWKLAKNSSRTLRKPLFWTSLYCRKLLWLKMKILRPLKMTRAANLKLQNHGMLQAQ